MGNEIDARDNDQGQAVLPAGLEQQTSPARDFLQETIENFSRTLVSDIVRRLRMRHVKCINSGRYSVIASLSDKGGWCGGCHGYISLKDMVEVGEFMDDQMVVTTEVQIPYRTWVSPTGRIA